MKAQLHFIGISGSLRKGSFNTMLLNAAAGLLPENVTMGIVSIADIPNYNADLDVPLPNKDLRLLRMVILPITQHAIL
jgi:chromate reductase, NAD(P)H dehydrogenase (quinone)